MRTALTLLLIGMACLRGGAQTQPFQRAIGDNASDWAVKTLATNGGYLTVGNTTSFIAGTQQIYLVKTGLSGNLLWTKTLGLPGYDAYAANAILTADNGVAIIGYRMDSMSQQAFVIKTDSNGIVNWSNSYHHSAADYALSITQTQDQGFMIAGSVKNTALFDYDAWMIKTDAQGDISWTKTFGNIDDDGIGDILQTADGGYAMTGWVYNPSDSSQGIYLLKMDANAYITWVKGFKAQNGLPAGTRIRTTSDHGYLLSGSYYNNSGGNDMFLMKTDSLGNVDWNYLYKMDLNSLPFQTIAAKTGGYVLAGLLEGGTPAEQGYLLRTGEDGSILWARTYSGANSIRTTSVVPGLDEGYLLSGDIDSNVAGFADVLLIKTDDSGHAGCNEISANATMMPFALDTFVPQLNISSGGTSTPVILTQGSGGSSRSLCSVTTAVSPIAISGFSVYPNPSEGRFTVSGETNGFDIIITNSLGQRVYQASARNKSISIDLGMASSGIYFYTIRHERQMAYGKLLIR